jgi:hypothetical protein
MDNSILSKKQQVIRSKNSLSKLPKELLMTILNTYAMSDLTNIYYNSLKISSKIMKFCMISKNIFNMVKDNIQDYFNANQYFYCNYVFKSKFPKFIFESLSIEHTISSKYIVFNNEVFSGGIEFPKYQRYIKTEPKEKKLLYTDFEYYDDYLSYNKKWDEKYPFELLSYFERVDFVNCKFNNCQLRNSSSQVTLYFLNCEIENTSNNSRDSDDKIFLDFHEGSIVMKACKIVNSLFVFTNTSNILLKDNVFLYEDCDEQNILKITDLQKELIIERNTFHICNKDNMAGGDMIKIINHTSKKYYKAEISFNCNIIKIFHIEIKNYFCPILLFDFEFSKFSKLIINGNIYYDCIKNKYSVRPLVFNTDDDNIRDIKSDFVMEIGITKAFLKTFWLCHTDNSLNEYKHTHNEFFKTLIVLAFRYDFKLYLNDFTIDEILEDNDIMYLKDINNVISLKLRSHYSENDIMERVLRNINIKHIDIKYPLSSKKENYALWI